ncbi:MAG: CzcE family metal-binding protein [Herminiimonas sp.]|uniref:CzcE family metal-binding protein n=1 Tax=Herminiimonas sp. TaxID=1926289 RepID=UPI0027217020|nr:CzcE family metal-binding protein [Herminiimonas sp.]MDO9420193.1 CzcE family metal-binding protein [Herminiimonas sp.]
MLIRSLTLAFAALMAFSMPAFSEPRFDLLGNPAPSNAATRTIVITPETKWVNVEGGEIINFVVGDKSFGWDFFVGSTVSSFDLSRVAPPGVLNRRIEAYVSPDPKYRGWD